MQVKDPHTTAKILIRLGEKQSRVAELRDELDRSLALDALFPGVFNGPGKVTTKVIGNMTFRPDHAVFRVSRADGKESELPVLRVPVELWGQSAFSDFIEGQDPTESSYGVLRPGCSRKFRAVTLAEFKQRGFA